MGISLTLFLNICLLLAALFPWSTAVLTNNLFNRKEFGSAFLFNFIFVTFFFLMMYKDFWGSISFNFNFNCILLSLSVCPFILLTELAACKMRYGKFLFVPIQTTNVFLIVFLIVLMPLMEEIIYRGYLYYLLNSVCL